MIEIGPASENEMVLAFLQGEINSPRFGERYTQFFNQLRPFGFIPQNLIENADLRSSQDNALRIEALKAVRGYRATPGAIRRISRRCPLASRWVGICRLEYGQIR